MESKFRTTLFYLLAVAPFWYFSTRLSANSGAFNQSESAGQKVRILLDAAGRRGIVLFNHRSHEAVVNPDPSFPHKQKSGIACFTCHHTVKEVTDARQFQKCSACHRADGNPDNPIDKEGYEVNTREAFHRACISCHRASNLKASNERFSDAGFTKCGECHDRGAQVSQLPARIEEQPPPPVLPQVSPPAPVTAARTGTPVDPPLGHAGPSRIPKPPGKSPDFIPLPDRWRIGFPDDPRYEKGRRLNPYRQNVWKGDYPFLGQHNFLNVTAESETAIDARRLPVPSDVSSQNPDSAEFFGRGRQFFFRQNFVLSLDYSHGDSAFKPVDYRIHVAPNFNVNYLHTEENGIVNVDVRRGNTRTDNYIALQDAFTEVRLGDTPRLLPFLRGRGGKGESPYFDTTSIRAGIQPFVSDFRGFIFSDVNLGLRLVSNYGSNRYQFNAACFHMLEKDTNSELNTRELRDQIVFAANLFRQDTFWKGYTSQFSFHYNNDRPGRHFDTNNFPVRPALVGSAAPHGIKASYFGWTGDGHIGRANITHAFYQAIGDDTRNPIAGRRVDINAQMAALELSLDRDWLRFKGSALWASGDKNPLDGKARGFDAILDFPEFAGGIFSFWNSQGIRLTQTGVALVNPNSLLPTLRSSKTEGQANFVNPGLFLYNLGLDAELTPKLKAILNVNYLQFAHVEPLELVLFQPGINKNIGVDYGIGFLYRPLLSENIIVAAGFSSLIPGTGFKDIYSSVCLGQGCGANVQKLYSGFVRLKFVF